MIYFSLQIYGVNSNTHYDPITSFVEGAGCSVHNGKVMKICIKIKNNDKAVMVDFMLIGVLLAEFEKYTFSGIRVSNILNELKLIKFDITETTEEHSMYLKEMRIFGPPALIFMTLMIARCGCKNRGIHGK